MEKEKKTNPNFSRHLRIDGPTSIGSSNSHMLAVSMRKLIFVLRHKTSKKKLYQQQSACKFSFVKKIYVRAKSRINRRRFYDAFTNCWRNNQLVLFSSVSDVVARVKIEIFFSLNFLRSSTPKKTRTRNNRRR